MIYCLTGEIIYLDALNYTAVIDCAGVGYKVTVTSNTLTALSSSRGKEVRVFTHMQVSENSVELFGFSDKDELDAFKMLTKVSGIGPKGALSILSTLTVKELSLAISAEDSKSIARSPGIGAKTAAKVVIELKDRFAKLFPVSDEAASMVISGRSAPKASSSKLTDARDALTVLGFSRAEAMNALKNVNTDGSVEDIIREALALLMK